MKEDYKKKRDYWNDKVKKLKDKKIEYKQLLDKCIDEGKAILKTSKKGKDTKKFISIQFGDILNDDLKHKNVDSVVLDMPQPWKAVEKIRSYLKLSGTFVSFSPAIEQVKKTTFALQENGFYEINTYELIKRKFQVKKNATHPEVRMIGHTGYMTFARKINDVRNPYREKKPKQDEFVKLNGMPLRG